MSAAHATGLGVNWFQLPSSNRLTHDTHFSPTVLVSRLHNQWPFCIEEDSKSYRGCYSPKFSIGSAMKRLGLLGDDNGYLRGHWQCQWISYSQLAKPDRGPGKPPREIRGRASRFYIAPMTSAMSAQKQFESATCDVSIASADQDWERGVMI